MNKAIALAKNLKQECTYDTVIEGFALSLQQAIGSKLDLSCSVAVCGVDNNPARCLAALYFRNLRIPVVFSGVSAEADHGYVFVQEKAGACFGCAFPDASLDARLPCPDTPAISEILQLIGALCVYSVDSLPYAPASFVELPRCLPVLWGVGQKQNCRDQGDVRSLLPGP
jgi:molybdopterin/thiamine biosynthesis adenylyltransferase